MQVVFDKFKGVPRNISDSMVPGNFAVQVSDSFKAVKTVMEDVEVHRKNNNGDFLYQAFEDGNGVLFPETGMGLTGKEITAPEINFDIRFQPIIDLVQQSVEIDSNTRIKDFTTMEILEAKAFGQLIDNPNFASVLLESLHQPSGIWDVTLSANFIAEPFKVIIHPGTTIQSIPITLMTSGDSILPILDIDDDLTFEVSVDGGTTFDVVTNFVPIILSAPGASLVVKVTNTGIVRRTLRSYSILHE